MKVGHRVPPLKDIPLDGPEMQTITRPRERHTGLIVAGMVLVVLAGVTVLLTASPAALTVMARAFGGK